MGRLGAIEIALWGQPVANLLGGKGGERNIEAVVDYCLGLQQAHGTTFLEGKV